MDLDDLGWNDFFQKQFDELGLTEILIGRIHRVEGGNTFGVLTEHGEMSVRLPGKLRRRGSSELNELPGIGDWILAKQTDLGNIIFKILNRMNKISRKVAGKEYKEQIMGANIDFIFIVMGLDGDFNIRRLERYLFMVTASGSTPVVILNKRDLLEKGLDEKISQVEKVTKDIIIHPVSAVEENGLDHIKQYLRKGITISLVGSSGVGKSTMINVLLGEERQDTQEVRLKDSKGRHVTASRRLFMIPDGGIIIDNPGMREIQLWGDNDSLEEVFSDIMELGLNCKFKDCEHISEPSCAVKESVRSGEMLSEERYNNYLKMKKELAYLTQKRNMSSEAVEKSKWKSIKKDTKQYLRQKREG
jgi:ribosome biogenesis GTPase